MPANATEMHVSSDDKDEILIDRLLTLATPTGLRIARAAIIWALSSALIAAGPLQQPRHVAYGFVVALMSVMNVTKYFAGLAVLLLLVLALAEPYVTKFL